METLAPAVVAVVVAHDPGPWFAETLASLAAQDYGELSVLILDAASVTPVAPRVAEILPAAFVRRFEENRGFGATANEVRSMVDGADYYLLCHDDVALDPDAVHLLVEEAFRSNAGVVSPKVVSWDDPGRLVHVGLTIDKGGSVEERVQPHEIDHGQHDAVRDVFVAPGGCTLVRADLFAGLGGFDPSIVAMGEDLDFCWRAQVAGARVLVAPDARVRHREVLASGERELDQALAVFEEKASSSGQGTENPDGVSLDASSADAQRDDGDGDTSNTHTPSGKHPVTLQELQRRHELLSVFTCYSRAHLIRVVPQIFLLAIGEVLVAEIAGNRARARAVVRAWRWNVAHLALIRARRSRLSSLRRVGDNEIRTLHVGGSARLSAYLRRAFQVGFHGVHADELAAAEDAEAFAAATASAEVAGSEHGGVVGSHNGDLVTADGPHQGVSGLPPAPTALVEAGLVTARSRLVVWLAAAFVIVLGSRGVLTGRLPVIGQFTPFPSWGGTWAQFFTGWQPSGVGTTAPASPALGLSAVVGTVLLGAMGLTQKVLIFGCLPLGAWGAVRLVRPFGSQRAALVTGLAYLAIPLSFNALALGRWGALVAYAGAPWVLGALFRATGLDPYAPAASDVVGQAGSEGSPGMGMQAGRGGAWAARHGRLGGALSLGVLIAVLISFTPTAAVAVVVVAVAVLIPSLLFSDGGPALRALRLALGALGVAAVICLPWVIGVLSAGTGANAVFGVPTAPSDAPTWGSVMRFAVGPIGGSPLTWGFVLAAAVPLVVARGPRFRWAVRLWSVALVSMLTAWASTRGWTAGFAFDPLVLLAPAAAAMAASIGLGIAAFEVDLRRAEFGWRQLTSGLGVAALALASVPTLVSALPGRWELPVNDFSQSVAWMHARTGDGAFRVLWLADPRSLGAGSWSAGDGLAYATSENGAPDVRWLWNGTSPGPAASLGTAVTQVRQGGTDRFGSLVAPEAVRYVVVLTAEAPVITGEQEPTTTPIPADLLPALSHQLDLRPVLTGTGMTVFANAAWSPQRAEASGTPVVTTSPLAAAPGTPAVAGARPVLPGPVASRSYEGPLAPGTVFVAQAPAGSWTLTTSNGASATRQAGDGWAPSFRITRATTATLHFDDGPLPLLSGMWSVAVWGLAVAALVDRQRLRRQWVRVGQARTRATARSRRQGIEDDAWSTEGVVPL